LSEIDETKRKPDLIRVYGPEIVGIPILGTLMAFGAALLFGFLGQAISKQVDFALSFPPWPLLLIIGVTVSIVRNRSSASPGALFAWVLPLVYFSAFAKSLWTAEVPNYTRQGWDAMFAHTCGGEGCFDPILACVPLVFSLSYSATALALRYTLGPRLRKTTS
jgi:hypothetical protein